MMDPPFQENPHRLQFISTRHTVLLMTARTNEVARFTGLVELDPGAVDETTPKCTSACSRSATQ